MKEKIYKTLVESMGFSLMPVGEDYYAFEYEAINFLWMPNEKDNLYLCISVPMIMDKSEVDDLLYYQLIDAVNAEEMYVKSCSYDESIWLCYERELLNDDEELEGILTRMILRLEVAYYRFFNELLKNKDEDDEIEEDEVELSMDEDSDNV